MANILRLRSVIAIALLVALVVAPPLASVSAEEISADAHLRGVQAAPTVDISDGSVDVDETIEVAIALSEAPNGLSGFKLNVTVTGGSMVDITGASYPPSFGLTETTVADDNTTVTLKAVDLNNETKPGDTDIRLASIEITGVRAGTTELTIEVLQMDDDSGESIQPETDPGTISVGDGSSSSTATSTQSNTDQSASTSTATETQRATSTQTRTSTRTATPSTTRTVASPTETSTTSTDATGSTTVNTQTGTRTSSITDDSTTTEGSTLIRTDSPSPTAPLDTTATTRTPGQPGFGVSIAVAVLLGVGLLAARRRKL